MHGFITPFKKKNGELFWVELSQTPVRRGKKLQYLVRTWIDITERKKAEESLARKAEEVAVVAQEWQNTFDSINDGISIHSPDFRILRANKALADMFGTTTQALIGQHCFKLVHGLNEPIQECPPACYKTGGQLTEIVRVEPHPGNRWLQVRCDPVLGSDGHLISIIHIARDITQLKQAEEKIKESEERYRGLYESTKDGIARVDMSGLLVECNQAYADMLGYPKEEVFKLTYKQITPPKWSDMEVDIVQNQILARGYSDEYEKEYIKKDGTVFPISLRGWLIKDESGIPTGMWAIVRDISERKQAEKIVKRKTEELERSNAELEQFAYVASHDLQEPLRMISSYVQLLASRYSGKLGRDADEFINYAVDGATRMQKLIRDLLAYSRVGTRGKAFKEVNLGSSLTQALENLDLIIKENNAEVTYDKLPAVYGDKDQITQVFQNLIENAIKFRGKKPPRVHISAIVRGDECICSVEDNGIGISPEFYGKIFQLFQRLHLREEYPGTGIGLALCKKIVERHGGRIWVESKLKAGSTFYFSIPVSKTEKNYEEYFS